MIQNNPQKIYTRKYLVIMETKNSNFHTSLYISEIQKLAFHLPYLRIIGINHCGDSSLTAFKCHGSFQDVLCFRYYAERLVASFPIKYNHNNTV